MKINSISSGYISAGNRVRRVEAQNFERVNGLKVVSLSQYLASPVSFRGRNKEQAIFYGAEVAPYSKAGGVGVVMKDYGFLLNPSDEVVVSPYYRADVDNKTGVVTPAKDEDGDYILRTNGGDLKLDLIAEKNMQWGNKSNNKIMLFNLRDEKDKVHYFVFDDATAHYKKPYEGGTVYATGSKSETNAWNGDPYAKNSKAFVELLPELIASKEGFNPATVICSDSQTAYTHEYMVQKEVKKEKGYDEIKTTHVGHNLGPGYCGETSMQNMFVNLGATPEQIKLIENDPIYKNGLLGDRYFEPFVRETLDETGTASATQIALHHASKDRANGNGFVKSFSVVAEDYAQSIAKNPQTAYNIHETAKGLYKDGVFNGILNPLEDASVDPTKKLPNPRYNEDCVDTDGTVYPAFELYPADATYEEMKAVKTRNKIKFLERLSAQDNTIITGDKARKAEINPEAKGIYDGPVIKPELIEKIKNGENVPMFVSWGRIDTQKGFDIALGAFEQFAKTPEGKDAIFVLGAGIDKSDESKRVETKVTEMLKDPELQGRIIHIAGWAPAYAMSSAGDAAVFTSRFEPCGLTDIEAMKYFCTPIVTNTQGFKQKNYDPRNPSEFQKATSYKTQHEFDLLKSQVNLIIDAYVNSNEEALEKVKAEFPVFQKENGEYDDSLFRTFASEYSEFIEAREKELKLEYPDGDYPENWNDWDELSKNYTFKYTGFARDLKDGILKAEMSEAIKAFVDRKPETKELMYNNLKTLNTGWKGNGVLHPTGESSYEMYKNLHMMKDYSAPTKSDVIAKDDTFIKNKMELNQKIDIQDRIGTYVIGALTGVGALLATRLKNAGKELPDEALKREISDLKSKLVEQDALRSEISALQAQIKNSVKTNKSNIIKAGAIGAVAALGVSAVLKVVVSKVKEKKQKEAADKAPIDKTPAQNPATPIAEKKTQAIIEGQNLFAGFPKYQ